MRTYTPKAADVTHVAHPRRREDQVLGRLATEAATLLQGKHKITWAPQWMAATTDLNASALSVNPRKLADKRYYRHPEWVASSPKHGAPARPQPRAPSPRGEGHAPEGSTRSPDAQGLRLPRFEPPRIAQNPQPRCRRPAR
jgi:large subunit ribosomal protein L13